MDRYSYMARICAMLHDEAEWVPVEMQQTLRAHGFEPELDAGNLWFYDKGNLRLSFGDDGDFDTPQSMETFCVLCRNTGAPFYEFELIAEGTLRDVLRGLGTMRLTYQPTE